MVTMAIIIFIVLLLLLSLSSSTVMYLKQTMFIGHTVLQLLCMYSLRYI
jgi:hypothetical protein